MCARSKLVLSILSPLGIAIVAFVIVGLMFNSAR